MTRAQTALVLLLAAETTTAAFQSYTVLHQKETQSYSIHQQTTLFSNVNNNEDSKTVSSTKRKPKAGKSGLGSYIDTLTGNTFTTPDNISKQESTATPALSGTNAERFLEEFKETSQAVSNTKISTARQKPVAGKTGFGSYLDALPGKTFVTPAVVTSEPARVSTSLTGTSGDGTAGYLGGIPGKSTIPTGTSTGFSGKPVSTIKPKPVAGKSGLGSYLDALPGTTFTSSVVVKTSVKTDSLSGSSLPSSTLPFTAVTKAAPPVVKATPARPGRTGLGGYLESMLNNTFVGALLGSSSSAAPVVKSVSPFGKKPVSASKGAAIGSYLDALPGKTFESVPPAVIVTTTASVVKSDASSVSGTSVSVAAGSQSGIPGKSTSSGFTGKPVSTIKPKPVAGKSGLGSYLDALPGTTFTSPVVLKESVKTDSLSGSSLSSSSPPGTAVTNDELLSTVKYDRSEKVVTISPTLTSVDYLKSLSKDSPNAGGRLGSVPYLASVTRAGTRLPGPGFVGYLDSLPGKTLSSVNFPRSQDSSLTNDDVMRLRQEEAQVETAEIEVISPVSLLPSSDSKDFDFGEFLMGIPGVKETMDCFSKMFGMSTASTSEKSSASAPKVKNDKPVPVPVPVPITPNRIKVETPNEVVPLVSKPKPGPLEISSTPVSAPSPTFVAKRERQPRDEKGGALVVMNEASVEFTAGVIGGVAGFAVAGPLGAVAVATVANYLSRREDDISTVVQSVAKAAIEIYNYLLKLESKYDILYQTKVSLEDALDKLKETEGTNGEAIDKIEKALANTVSRMSEISDEYDLWGEATGALGVVGDLVEKTVTKISILNRDLQLFERLFSVMMEAAATARVAVVEATKDAYAEEAKLDESKKKR